jgi:DNA-binding CsgD family transcriptional regulator
MRAPTAYFWILPILILAGISVLAVVFFLRYRKTVRHFFLTALAVGLYFFIYILMVYETTLPQRAPGLVFTTGVLILSIYSILSWDMPLSYLYLLNRPLGGALKRAVAALAILPSASWLALILLPLGRSAGQAAIFPLADLMAAAPALAALVPIAAAAQSLKGGERGGRFARAVFAASGLLFIAVGFLCRYRFFASSYPQRELSFVTTLLIWDMAATALAAAFGPGESPEGPVVSVPDAFVREASLTAREAETLELLAGGASYKDISAALGVSMPAVKKRISSVYRKSGAANRVELVNILLEYSRK